MTSIISPLRYPGSKRRLAKYIYQVLQENALKPDLFVEPFAGGASVSLQLLNDGAVEQIGLIEKDPLVASFWEVVFSKKKVKRLIEQIEAVDVTLEKWHEFKHGQHEGKEAQALACLFLNRTSFSGILAPSAGPLGGQEQQSPYPIDCRFPKQTLVSRIRQAHALRDKVAFVWQTDWTTGLKRIAKKQSQEKLPQDVFFYFDPPFFHKADRLYNFYFANGDHAHLRDTILTIEENWLLSYDYCDEVTELYGGNGNNSQTDIEMLYSASQNGGQRAVKEVILTNLTKLPDNKKLWHRQSAP